MGNPIQGLRITTNIVDIKKEFDLLIQHINKNIQKPFNINFNINQVQQQIQQINNEIAKINSNINSGMNVNNSSGLNSFSQKFKVANGEAETLVQTTKQFTNEVGQSVKIVENLSKETGEVTSRTTVLTDEFKKQNDIVYKESVELLKEKYRLINEINVAEKKGYNDTAISLKTRQGDVENQLGEKVGNLNDENIVKFKQLENDLSQKQFINEQKLLDVKKKQTVEIEEQIVEYKKLMNIKLQNLQSKYGTLVDTNEIKNFKNSLDGLDATNFNKSKISNEFAQLEANVKSSSRALKLAQSDAKSFGDEIGKDAQKFMLWMGIGTVIMSSIHFFTEGIKYTNELNESLTQISIVTGKSQEQVRQLGFEYANLAKQMSVSTKEIATASVEFYRQGLTQNEVMDRLKTTTQYAKISSLDFKQSAEILTATVNSMGVSIQKASDVFAYLGDATATGADEVGIAMSKVAGSASVAQIPLEKISSWIAEVSSKTRESAETIGFSFQSILSRYAQIKESGFNEEDSTKINDVTKALSSIGIMATDSSGQLRNFGNVMDELGSKWKSLDRNTQAYIGTTLAGTRQQSRLFNLLNSYQDSLKLYNDSLSATNVTQQKYNLWLQGTEAHLNQLKLAGTNIWQQVFNSEDLKMGIDMLTNIVTGMGSLLKVFGTVPTVIGTVVFAFMMLNKSFDVSKITKYVGSILSLPMAYQEAKAEGLGMSAALNALGIGFDIAKIKAIAFQAVVSLGLSLAITGIITLITKAMSKTEDLSNQLTDLSNSMQEVNQTTNLIEKYKELQKQIELNDKVGDDNTELKKQQIELQKQLAQSFPSAIDGYTKENEAIVSNIKSIEKLNEAKKNQILAESGNAYNDLYNKLATSQTKVIHTRVDGDFEQKVPSLIEKYEELSKARDKALSEGNSASAGNYAKDLVPILKNIDEFNKASIQLYSIGQKNVEYFDMASGKLVKYSDYLAQNTQATNENSNSRDNNANSANNQAQSQEELSKSFQSSTDKIRTYNQMLAEMSTKNGLSASSMKDIIANHQELIPYLQDEASLRDVLTQKVKEEEANQVNAYNKMISASADYYNAKIRNNATAQNAINGALKAMVGTQGNAYSVDLKNYNNLNQLKLDATVKTVKSVAGIWARYYQAESQQFTEDFWRGIMDMSMSNNPAIRQQASEMEKIAKQTQDAVNRMNGVINSVGMPNISFQGLNTEGISAIDRANNEASKSAEDTAKKAEQARDEAYSAIDDINKKLMDSIKQQVEDEKKALDDRLTNYQNFINDKLKALDNEYTTEDRQRKLAEEKKRKEELQAQQAELLLDSSAEAKNRRYDLQQQIDAQQQVIDDLNRDYSREDRKTNLQNQLDAYQKQIEDQKKALDEKYTDAEIARMAKNGLLTGVVNIGNSAISVKQILLDAMQKSGEAFEVTGAKIQTELIDKLIKVQQLLASMDGNGNINGNVALNIMGSHANGGLVNYTGLAQLHGSDSIPEMVLNGGQYSQLAENIWKLATRPIETPKLNNIDNRNNGGVTLSFENLIGNIQGNMDDSTLSKVKDFVKNEIPKIVADAQVNNDKKLGSYRPRLL